ncbi:thioesterase II family protein [Oceanobacillus manasiensis]|uniref:thioesterase II family protein n=1 Tax=Oceanobacillus manasiensis TaxID=586413 RepID=UPI000693E77F|nr:thioesterase domain-containing protein [Oceanobacillus manasiensis]
MSEIDLFCIPYAGGSASAIYGKWAQELAPIINLMPLELAGHGKRMSEPFHSNINGVVEDLLKNMRNRIQDRPYAIYAHSMGTIIAYELVVAICTAGLPQPHALFLSGRQPPDYQYVNKNFHKMSEKDFLQEIKDIGGTPEKFFNSQELIDAFLPILRDDYRIIENYSFLDRKIIFDSDIVFFYSDNDDLVNKPGIINWERFTKKSFEYYEFNGGHFFLNEVWRDIVRVINKKLISN